MLLGVIRAFATMCRSVESAYVSLRMTGGASRRVGAQNYSVCLQ